jgi:hypothetical protein
MQPVKPLSFYLLGLVMFIVGMKIGISLPDIDQYVPFLIHRSILTHGLLLPLLVFLAVESHRQHGHQTHFAHQVWRPLVMGLCLGSAIHLCFDLFPSYWRGYALIWVPLHGRTSPAFSWLWLAASCTVCIYLALLLIRFVFEVLQGAIGMILVFLLNSAGERTVIGALLVLVIATGLALIFPSQGREKMVSMKPKSF